MLKIRNSEQRNRILRLVENNDKHYTADEIYILAKQEDPKISKGTVYRDLNQLVEIGKLKRLPMPQGPDHYDFRLDDHYHFFCRNCQRVYDVPIAYQKQWNHVQATMKGFQIEGHEMVVYGLCPGCNDSKQENDYEEVSM